MTYDHWKTTDPADGQPDLGYGLTETEQAAGKMLNALQAENDRLLAEIAALRAAKDEHEDKRIQREAYLLAWSVRFNIDTLQRFLRHTEELFALRDLTPGEARDLTITAHACIIAETITDEELIAAGFPARPRRVA